MDSQGSPAPGKRLALGMDDQVLVARSQRPAGVRHRIKPADLGQVIGVDPGCDQRGQRVIGGRLAAFLLPERLNTRLLHW